MIEQSPVVGRVALGKPRPLPLKNRELVTEDSVLSRKGAPGPSHTRECAKEQKEP